MNIKKVILASIVALILVAPTLAQQEFLIIGNSMLMKDKYAEALRAYDKAVQLDPGFAEAWYNRGIVLEMLGLDDEAEASLIMAFELDPNLYAIYQNMDQLAAGQGLDQPALDQADAFSWDNQVSQDIYLGAIGDGITQPTGSYSCSGTGMNQEIYKQAAGQGIAQSCGDGSNSCSSCSGI